MTASSNDRRRGSQPIEGPDGAAALSPDLFDLIYERGRLHERHGRYDPWDDLAQRPGVDIGWHTEGNSGSRRYPNALGLTNFAELRVTLLVGQPEHQLRCTLAHELVHLDRGPISLRGDSPADARAVAREEQKVHLLAAQRIIDPVVYDALMRRYDGKPTTFQVRTALGCDRSTIKAYTAWRRRVRPATAMRAWENGRGPISWPPAWVRSERYEEAARWISASSGRSSSSSCNETASG
jgi:hypothetical protein